MKIDRIMIAAPKSGSGKTVVTCALLQLLKDRGIQAVSFKCGPDYIDPMFHEGAIGIPSKNLDTFFMGEEHTRALFCAAAEGKDFAVMEGVMGLYDGLGGIREEGSSYHLAKVTKTPIVLVVDAKGMGRSVVSLIAGFLAYDEAYLIRGVILNRVSKGYYVTIKPLIEEELKIQALGFLPEREELQIESRYLGLVTPKTGKEMQEKLRAAALVFTETVSMEGVAFLAEDAEELEKKVTEASDGGRGEAGKPVTDGEPRVGSQLAEEKTDKPVIAVARDEAFCFYYEDNLRLLQESGAGLVFFSPLRDEALPKACHGLLLGGGYPELYAKELKKNTGMRATVKAAIENGMPVVAECGGFMYLHSFLKDRENHTCEMAGVLPAACFYTGKPVRFGYIELRGKKNGFLPEGETIRGHEFHYYDSTENGSDAIAVKPVTGKAYSCMIEEEDRWMGFPHLYYPSNPSFARRFVEKTKKYKNRTEQK